MNASLKILVDTFKTGGITETKMNIICSLFKQMTGVEITTMLDHEYLIDAEIEPNIIATYNTIATIFTKYRDGIKVSTADKEFLESVSFTSLMEKLKSITSYQYLCISVKNNIILSTYSSGIIIPTTWDDNLLDILQLYCSLPILN